MSILNVFTKNYQTWKLEVLPIHSFEAYYEHKNKETLKPKSMLQHFNLKSNPLRGSALNIIVSEPAGIYR